MSWDEVTPRIRRRLKLCKQGSKCSSEYCCWLVDLGQDTMASRDKATRQLEEYAAQRSTTETATTSSGNPLDSITSSLTAGPRGPILLQVRVRTSYRHWSSARLGKITDELQKGKF